MQLVFRCWELLLKIVGRSDIDDRSSEAWSPWVPKEPFIHEYVSWRPHPGTGRNGTFIVSTGGVSTMNSTTLVGQSILVVEDETLIAIDIADAFERAGARVKTASTLRIATRLMESDGLSAAVIDHRLGQEDSSVVRCRLKQRGVPYVIHTGFNNVCGLGLASEPQVFKPARPELLVAVVERLLRQRGAKPGR